MPRTTDRALPRDATTKSSLLRRLAVAKVRELRRQGLTRRAIGARYVRRREWRSERDGVAERVLRCPRASAGRVRFETTALVRGLDTLPEGVALYDAGGQLRHVNAHLATRLGAGELGDTVRRELDYFASTIRGLAEIRALQDRVDEDMTMENLPLEGEYFRLRGSWLGFDLLGFGSTIVIIMEPSRRDPLASDVLRARFGLTPQEARIARMMVSGMTNADIARALTISPHTARHHTERILRKLDVRSRTEAASRVFTDDARMRALPLVHSR